MSSNYKSGHEKANRQDKAFKPNYWEEWRIVGHGNLPSPLILVLGKGVRRIAQWSVERIVGDEQRYNWARNLAGRWQARELKFRFKGGTTISGVESAAVLLREWTGELLRWVSARRRRRVGRFPNKTSAALTTAVEEIHSIMSFLEDKLDLGKALEGNDVDAGKDPACDLDEETVDACKVLQIYFLLRAAVQRFAGVADPKRVWK